MTVIKRCQEMKHTCYFTPFSTSNVVLSFGKKELATGMFECPTSHTPHQTPTIALLSPRSLITSSLFLLYFDLTDTQVEPNNSSSESAFQFPETEEQSLYNVYCRSSTSFNISLLSVGLKSSNFAL